MRGFAALSEEDRKELPGTLAWLLFSPQTRDGAANPIFDNVTAFAAGELNPHTKQPFPYRCWPELTRVLVAGGAKYCPTTSAQLESLFTGLTRQQGASKNNITQPQISYEARCRKNRTMDSLTPNVLRDYWTEAKAVKAVLDAKGFWVCDLGLARKTRRCYSLSNCAITFLCLTVGGGSEPEQEAEGGASGGGGGGGGGTVGTFEVERIMRHKKDRQTGEYIYVTKWKGYSSSENTKEPESHLLKCKVTPLVALYLIHA